jgi:hypothetical protein
MELQDASAARDLLDVVVSAAKQSRRVLFFCACESPIAVDGCHRYLARDALLREAKRARVPLTVQEWPGTAPSGQVDLVVEADEACADALDRKRDWIPLPESVKLADLAGLPFAALVRFESGSEPVHALAGQVLFRKGRWHLRRLDDPATEPEALIAAAPAHRRGLELQPESVARG